MLSIGRYNVCILDLVTDDMSGKLSAIKIWDTIGKIVMTKVLLAQKDVSVDLYLAYGIIVTGSHVAMQFLKRKYPNVAPDNTDPSKG